MEFKINIQKTHLWLLIILIVAVGFVVAQAAKPNPGHGADEVTVTYKGQEKSLQETVDAIVNSRSAATWISTDKRLGALPYRGDKAYSLTAIPATAKEILVYASIRRGDFGKENKLGRYDIYTQEGNKVYKSSLGFYDYGNAAWVLNSDTFWLPLTPEKKLHVKVIGTLTGNVNSDLIIIGYR
jgi:hypothetical protein|tara:strand:+ start:9137 stop:9685 length:549 start_codon:yes stop_codon:yes gene_type:complete